MRGRLVLSVVLLAWLPIAAGAQDEAGALADPADGAAEDDRGTPLHLTSEGVGDRVRVRPEGGGEDHRCRVPCELSLRPGRYDVRFTRSGIAGTLDLGLDTVLMKARPGDGVELGIGITAIVLGALTLGAVAAFHEELCWDFDSGSACSPEYTVLALGVGVMAVAIGIGLAVDSAGSLDVQTLHGLRRRPPDG